MKLTIRAFGIAKDIVGASKIDLEMDSKCSSSDLQTHLLEVYPDFKGLSAIKLAVNETYAQGDEILQEGDQLAIIPPVSGG
ncbi:MAG: MoaD/ThiS family protein [Flavobacteriales bacterium]